LRHIITNPDPPEGLTQNADTLEPLEPMQLEDGEDDSAGHLGISEEAPEEDSEYDDQW